ncbi:uncharacterized protein LOC132704933 [Cylas formicarius]|uniref:uncharacterized protein LOC132704933 n=1 Tax=Cylas formicarius TaxID=197179 RepID=UPI002958C9C9|nr:uncharacterized protein LOC132704933 [Cylas formicarius]
MLISWFRRIPKSSRVVGARNFGGSSPKYSNVLSGIQMDIPNMNFHEYLFSKNEKFYGLTAYECGVTGRKYTYDDVRIMSRNLSKNLRKKLRLNRGDVVAILLQNIPEYPVAAYGIYEAGLTVTTMNPIFTANEIFRQLASSSTKAVITMPEHFDKVKLAAQHIKKDLPVICVKTKNGESLPRGGIDFFEFTSTDLDMPSIQPSNMDDVCTILYSSGTTGLPKGVELTHRNLVAEQSQFCHTDVLMVQPPTETTQEVIPGVLPMYHSFGFFIMNIFMSTNGVKVVTIPKFTPDWFISTLRNHRMSVMVVAPPLISFLTNYPNVKDEYLKSLKFVLTGAAPLSKEDEERFLKKTGPDTFISQGYGLTECPSIALVTKGASKRNENARGSVGIPHANTQIKVVAVDDPTGTPLGPNQNGEIFARGPQMMKGYLNNPEATKNAFVDGWLKTGDIGYYDEDGLLYVCDRLKELIKVSGFQVAPAELEAVLRDYPAVEDAAVIGVPHERYGEVPRAYVVPKNGSKLCPVELNNYFMEKVAKYKRLMGGIEITHTIPKSASGKILRKELKMQYDGGRR